MVCDYPTPLSSAAVRLENVTRIIPTVQPRTNATGPPGTNYAVMKKAFEEGWGGVIAKTVSLDSSKVRAITHHVVAHPAQCLY